MMHLIQSASILCMHRRTRFTPEDNHVYSISGQDFANLIRVDKTKGLVINTKNLPRGLYVFNLDNQYKMLTKN